MGARTLNALGICGILLLPLMLLFNPGYGVYSEPTDTATFFLTFGLMCAILGVATLWAVNIVKNWRARLFIMVLAIAIDIFIGWVFSQYATLINSLPI
jgi:cation transport ATPase